MAGGQQLQCPRTMGIAQHQLVRASGMGLHAWGSCVWAGQNGQTKANSFQPNMQIQLWPEARFLGKPACTPPVCLSFYFISIKVIIINQIFNNLLLDNDGRQSKSKSTFLQALFTLLVESKKSTSKEEPNPTPKGQTAIPAPFSTVKTAGFVPQVPAYALRVGQRGGPHPPRPYGSWRVKGSFCPLVVPPRPPGGRVLCQSKFGSS